MSEEKDKPQTPAEIIPPVPDNSTLVALQRAEIDMQITTAKAYPRNLTQFKANALAMATLDEETADSMTYQLPRDGKLIEGPSIRLAEIAGSCWGNVRYGARVIEVGDDYLTARGACQDLERNVSVEVDVRRRITGKKGRFGADMIQTTGMAACSIALRNAVFKVVPMAFIKPIAEAAKRVAAGDEKTLAARRDAALLWFKEKGIKAEHVCALLGVTGKDDISLEHLAKLSGVRNAIKDGEATLEEFFAEIITAGGPKKVVTVETLAGGQVSGANEQTPGAPAPTPTPEAPKGTLPFGDGKKK